MLIHQNNLSGLFYILYVYLGCLYLVYIYTRHRPFNRLLLQAESLTKSDIDTDLCGLYYYEGKDSYTINNDDNLFDAIEDGIKDGKLLIDIKCDYIDNDNRKVEMKKLVEQKNAYLYITKLNSASIEEQKEAETGMYLYIANSQYYIKSYLHITYYI